MRQSENIDELAKAFVAFKAKHGDVPLDEEVEVKDKSGKFLYRYKFASLPGIKREIEPSLTDVGLAVTQHIDEGNKLISCLVHISGQFMCSALELNEMYAVDQNGIRINTGPQDYGKTVTFARRYAYCAILGLIGDSADENKSRAKLEARSATGETSKLPWLNIYEKNGHEFTPEGAEAYDHMTNGPGNIESLLQKYQINKRDQDILLAFKQKAKNEGNKPEPAEQKAPAELPWLNKTYKNSDRETREYQEAVYAITVKGEPIEYLEKHWRINRDTRTALTYIKEHYKKPEELQTYTSAVGEEINACKNIAELDAVWKKYPMLQIDKKFKEAMGMKQTILSPPKHTPELVLK
jgi:hypothetical protein